MRIQRMAMSAAVALSWMVAIDAAHAGDGRKALRILPKDTAGVFVINVDRFAKSPYYADAMSFFRSKGGVGSSVAAFSDSGVDLEKDVDTVVIGLPKAGGDDGVMVLEGRFDRRKLARAAAGAEESFQKGKHRGVVYWSRKDAAVAVVGKRFVATKSKRRIEAVIDAFKAKRKSAANSKAIKRLMAHVDSTKDMWLVADSAMFPTSPLQMDGITGKADLAKGLALTIDILMPGNDEADALESQLDMAVKSVSSHAVVGNLMRNVTVSRRGAEVVINASFDDAELKIIGGLMSKMGGMTF